MVRRNIPGKDLIPSISYNGHFLKNQILYQKIYHVKVEAVSFLVLNLFLLLSVEYDIVRLVFLLSVDKFHLEDYGKINAFSGFQKLTKV
jgi:hypothetical protein